MRSYIEKELPALIAREFPADMARQSIMGHSMGGHGAMTIALRNPKHTQLMPERLVAACGDADINLLFRYQCGYDHSYYFVSSFIADHLNWHALKLYDAAPRSPAPGVSYIGAT